MQRSSNGRRFLNLATANDHVATDHEQSSVSLKDHIYDVVIVGAGWAGIAAANLLCKRGCENIQILEATNHVGGRAHSIQCQCNDKDVPVDMGAMWIHGASKNIINVLAMKYGVETYTSNYDTQLYKTNQQGPYSVEEIDDFREELYENGFFPFQAARQESVDQDEPLQKSADLYIEQIESPEKKRITKQMLRGLIEVEYSGLLQDQSLLLWNDDYDLGGSIDNDDYFVPSGHGALIGPFASDLVSRNKVKLSSPVRKIDYQNSEKVQITYNDPQGTEQTCNAKTVILTVPLGVLKAELIEFSPQLPQQTQKSIRRIGMGRMNKIFLFWKDDDMFWPKDVEVLGDVSERESNFLFFNPRQFNGNLPMLFAFFQGSGVDQIEKDFGKTDPKEYETKIQDLAMDSLRSMFGNDIPLPEKVICTRWNVDEHTLGAYSFNQVGMDEDDRDVLAKPIGENGQIVIAGEATHRQYFATTTGAFLTGTAAARKVLRSLQSEKKLSLI